MEKYLGQNIPKLGFGLMRLPMLNVETEEIDLAQVMDMVDLFLENGFCYFDTAYGYNNGKSEQAAKKVLTDRYPRDHFLLATKLPAWGGAKTKEEARQMFYTSLERTGAGFFDFYLLHNLGEKRTQKFYDFDIWDFLRQKKQEGLIHHLGFSFHDQAKHLDQLLTENPDMDFVQLQINYADWENPMIESRLCYETARKHGKPVIIMEPVKGGILASPPPSVAEIFQKANPQASPASWAVRYAASLEGVITVLSGMSNLDQMKDNIAYMKNFVPLSADEQNVITQARETLAAIPSIPCTSCKYCMPGCPQSINITGVFKCMNMIHTFNTVKTARNSYIFATRDYGRASDCIECGQCESICPQHLPIIEELKKAAATLE